MRTSDAARLDVVVVGAGVIGAATALELGRRGFRTSDHVGIDEGPELARFKRSGVVVIKSATGQYKKAIRHFPEVGVAHEDWDAAELQRRCPLLATRSFYPPKAPDGPAFASSDSAVDRVAGVTRADGTRIDAPVVVMSPAHTASCSTGWPTSRATWR